MSYSAARILELQEQYRKVLSSRSPEELEQLYCSARGKYNSQYQNFCSVLGLPILNKSDVALVCNEFFDIERAHSKFLEQRNSEFLCSRNTDANFTRRKKSLDEIVRNCNLYKFRIPNTVLASLLQSEYSFRSTANTLVFGTSGHPLDVLDPWGDRYLTHLVNKSNLGLIGCCPYTSNHPRHAVLDRHVLMVSRRMKDLKFYGHKVTYGHEINGVFVDLIIDDKIAENWISSDFYTEGVRSRILPQNKKIKSAGYIVRNVFYETKKYLEQYEYLSESLRQDPGLVSSYHIPTWKSAKHTRFFPHHLTERLLFVEGENRQ